MDISVVLHILYSTKKLIYIVLDNNSTLNGLATIRNSFSVYTNTSILASLINNQRKFLHNPAHASYIHTKSRDDF